MFVGILRVESIIPTSASLKDKRQVLRSLKDRLTNKFNVSVSEVDYMDKWQRSAIGIAVVSGSESHLHKEMGEIERFIREFPALSVTSIKKEVLDEGPEAEEDFGPL